MNEHPNRISPISIEVIRSILSYNYQPQKIEELMKQENEAAAKHDDHAEKNRMARLINHQRSLLEHQEYIIDRQEKEIKSLKQQLADFISMRIVAIETKDIK